MDFEWFLSWVAGWRSSAKLAVRQGAGFRFPSGFWLLYKQHSVPDLCGLCLISSSHVYIHIYIYAAAKPKCQEHTGETALAGDRTPEMRSIALTFDRSRLRKEQIRFLSSREACMPACAWNSSRTLNVRLTGRRQGSLMCVVSMLFRSRTPRL